MTLVDVHLAARPCVALQTLTVEGAVCIHTLSRMLTRVTVGCNTQEPVVSRTKRLPESPQRWITEGRNL